MTTASARRRLAALVVNYNSGQYARRCVESLIASWRLEGRDPADLEVVVVDNQSPKDQSEALAAIEALGVLVDRADENLGYARGMNRAFAHTSGGPNDVVAILNPDLFFLPGALGVLMGELENPRVGLVDPKVSIDPGRELLLPRNPLPTLYDHTYSALAHRSSSIARAYARRRLAIDLPWFESTDRYVTDMLSGACMFMRRETVQRLGGTPMDAVFPLYYEDTDLCRRVRRLGLELVHHGGAPVLHYWSRSAGIGAAFEGEPRRRFMISQAIYFRRYYGALGGRFARWMSERGAHWGATRSHPTHDFVHLGECERPPVMELDGDGPFLIESNFSPNFLLSAGTLGEGRTFRFSDQAWDWIFAARIYLRAIDRRTLRLRGAWTIDRVGQVRHHGHTIPEVLGEGAAALLTPLPRAAKAAQDARS
jgi:N-acetylglucosaminyl-diphospho-decaprenol L-rhamnosyltransferase